ncbi:phage major capsid protein, HK97 family [Loktanella sp. DSM 29012]|nr:phage major capsid protein, HK97 family [Loktanella sp. DSM 29012]
MDKTEVLPRTGKDLSPAEDLRIAIGDFVAEFKTFSTGVHATLQKQEDRMNKLDRKSMMAQRPALAMAAAEDAPHQKAFAAYLRSGDDDGLRGLTLEGKGMSTAVAADGGYLVDPQTADTIRSTLSATASIRAIANIVNVDATSFDVLIDHTEMGAGWATESDPTTETDAPQIDRITIPLHELSALPKASQRLLDDSAFDIEGWLAQRIADKFARS